MRSPILVDAPADTPVTLTEVKAHCRVDGTASDTVLTIYLNAAIGHLDGLNGVLGRALVTQTWRQDFSEFDDPMRLPFGPLDSIDSITYYDADNAQQTLSSDVYTSGTDEQGPFVTLASGEEWPATYERDDAVSVNFIVGTDADDVPAEIKLAILMMVSHWNEKREGVSADSMFEIPMGVSYVLSPHRQMRV